MTKIWPLPVIAILNKGFSLDAIGVDNWGFRKEDAISTISRLANNGTPILKGNVFELMNGAIENNYDSWECELQAGESIRDLIIRSADQAIDYIEDYPTDANIFFVLTPAV